MKANDMQARMIRRSEVEKLTGLSCSTIYTMMQEERFPRQVKLSKRAVGWLVSDIEAWINSRVELSQF